MNQATQTKVTTADLELIEVLTEISKVSKRLAVNLQKIQSQSDKGEKTHEQNE